MAAPGRGGRGAGALAVLVLVFTSWCSPGGVGFVLPLQRSGPGGRRICCSGGSGNAARGPSSVCKARLRDKSDISDEEDDLIGISTDAAMELTPATDPTIIYKRLDEQYELPEEYDGAYPVRDLGVDDFLALNDAGKVMLRIVIVGGGALEAEMVKRLSAEEELVTGTYVSWDSRVAELDPSMSEIPFNNLLPCERPDLAPQQAELAWFLHADAVIIGESYAGEASAMFVRSLGSELAKKGIAILGPDAAANLRQGNFAQLLDLQAQISPVEIASYKQA